jgi:hypothetical protein
MSGALGNTDADKPEMTFYRGGRSRTAVIIAPGGAYRNLPMEGEGRQEAELRVTAQTPPTFLYQTTNHNLVPVENSVVFCLALRKGRVPAEMHLFENESHGSGMGLTDPALSGWPTLLTNWLRGRGLVTAPVRTN